jgi:hypothetical protein
LKGRFARSDRTFSLIQRFAAVIDLSKWMAGNPVGVLATNFGRPAEAFRAFPTREGIIE